MFLKHASWLILLAALAAAPIVAGTLDPHWGSWTPAAGTLACLILAAAGLRLLARRLGGEQERLATPIDVPVLVLVAATLASLLFSVNRHAGIVEVLRLLSGVAAFALALEMVHEGLRAGDGAATAEASGAPVGSAGQERKRRKREARRDGGEPAAPAPRGSAPGRTQGSPLRAWSGAALWAALIAGAAWAGARGVQEYLAALREGLGAWRVFGGFSHPNTLIAHLALTMPLMAGAALALRARKDSLRAAWPIPATVLLIALAAGAFTGSRLGFLAVGLGGLVFLLAFLAARRSVTPAQAALIAIGFVLSGALVILAVPTLRYRAIAAFTGAEAFSLQFRFTTWAAAWRDFLAHPLTGSGAGTFPAIMTRYSETSYSQTAHNHFVQTAAETGIAGVAALLALLVLWFAAVLRGSEVVGWWGGGCSARTQRHGGRPTPPLSSAGNENDLTTSPPHHPTTPPPHHPTTPPPHDLLLRAAALGGVAASTAYAAVDFGWSIAATGWVLWALLGAGLAAAGAVRPVRARAGVETVLLVLLAAGLLLAGALTVASARHNRAMLLKAREPAAAVEAFEGALRADPYSPETHRELGRLLGGIGILSGDRARIDEGLSHLETSVRLAPTTALNAYHLGVLAMRAGHTARAEAAFRQALEWDPNSPPTWRQLGSLFERSRPEETLAAARRLLEIEGSRYGTIRALGQHVDPNFAFGHYWMAEHLRRSGSRDAARAEYEKAGEILKRHRESLQGIAGITPEGTQGREPEPEVQALESAAARALARL